MTIRKQLSRTAALAAAVICTASFGCQRPSELGAVANLEHAAKIREALLGGAAGDAAEAAPVGTGWGTLRGTFTFEGDPPQMPPYKVDKDHDTCAPGGNAPLQQLLVVDPSSRGIANIAIYARDVSRVHDEAGPSDQPIVFDQKSCVFLTRVLAMTVNQPVSIKNSDPVGHNTKIDGQNFFNQTIESGGSVPWTAQREESTPQSVKCSIHPWMQSYVLPRENQYFAVTAKDGTFEIKNLPAGEKLELQIWHENAAGTQGALIVDSEAAKELKWSKKGRITIQLEENETREINIAVPASAFRAG